MAVRISHKNFRPFALPPFSPYPFPMNNYEEVVKSSDGFPDFSRANFPTNRRPSRTVPPLPAKEIFGTSGARYIGCTSGAKIVF